MCVRSCVTTDEVSRIPSFATGATTCNLRTVFGCGDCLDCWRASSNFLLKPDGFIKPCTGEGTSVALNGVFRVDLIGVVASSGCITTGDCGFTVGAFGKSVARLALITSLIVGSVLRGARFIRCTFFFVERSAKISLILGCSISYISTSTVAFSSTVGCTVCCSSGINGNVKSLCFCGLGCGCGGVTDCGCCGCSTSSSSTANNLLICFLNQFIAFTHFLNILLHDFSQLLYPRIPYFPLNFFGKARHYAISCIKKSRHKKYRDCKLFMLRKVHRFLHLLLKP